MVPHWRSRTYFALLESYRVATKIKKAKAVALDFYFCALYCPHRRTWASTGENYSSKNYVVEYELTKTIDEQFRVAQVNQNREVITKAKYIDFLCTNLGSMTKQCHEVIERFKGLGSATLQLDDIAA